MESHSAVREGTDGGFAFALICNFLYWEENDTQSLQFWQAMQTNLTYCVASQQLYYQNPLFFRNLNSHSLDHIKPVTILNKNSGEKKNL